MELLARVAHGLSGGVQLSRLDKARQGNTFAQCRDAAIIAVFRATCIRLAELISDGVGSSSRREPHCSTTRFQ